jgi:hypothetical protein
MDCSVAGLCRVRWMAFCESRVFHPEQPSSTQWRPIVQMEAVACRKRPRPELTAHVSVACGHGAAQDWRRIRREANQCRLSTIRRQALGCWTTFSVAGRQAVGVAQQCIVVVSEGGASM